MINILLPMAGTSSFFDGPEYPFPKPIIEVQGKLMIEHVIDNLKTIKNSKFLFILREEDCVKFHLDSTVKLLAGDRAEIIRSKGETKGASCTAMLAIKHIQNDSPLIIANSDQIINEDLNLICQEFTDNNVDAGCITFNSVHPRWS